MGRVFVCLLAWLVLPACADPRVHIALLPDAQVAGPKIQLGEIARMRSPDLELLRQLVHLDVGRAPGVGETASIQPRHLSGWIERQVGVRLDEMEWSGARESRIQRHAARVSGEEIARVAQTAVQALHPGKGAGREVSVFAVPRDLQAPPGPVRLQPRLFHGAHLRTRTLVWVDVWVADAFVRAIPVSLDVSGVEPWRSASRGLVREPDTAQASALLIDPEMQRPAVERGDTAALRTNTGAVQLESRVQVLEDGRLGELVRVRQQGATALLSARVIGPGRVEVAP